MLHSMLTCVEIPRTWNRSIQPDCCYVSAKQHGHWACWNLWI